MMIRSQGRYFDFNGDVEMERRVKLFERIDETLGDFAYEFELPKTSNNFSIFGNPVPDSVKIIYKQVPAEILDDDGVPVYIGQIRYDRNDDTTIYCSFFSGNYNWIGLLSGNITEIDFSDLDTDFSEAEIINAGVNTEGIFFPLVDTGGLVTRGSANLVVKDFTGMIFLKTAFNRIFKNAGVKIQGDLMTDPIFNAALISRINIDPQAIDNRSSYVGKGIDQTITAGGTPSTTKITFTDETTVPFFDGAQNNFSSSTYTADVKMDVKIETFIRFMQTSSYNPANDQIIRFKIYINGIEVFHKSADIAPFAQTESLSYLTTLEAGDYVEIFAFIDSFPDTIDTVIYSDSWLKVTPTFLFKVFGNSLLPNWTQAQFVGNVLSLFCGICDYEPVSKTLTIDLFNNIKTKDPIDLSEFVNIKTVDTSEFIGDFSKNNLLKYGDSDFEDIKAYNVKYAEPYAAGIIAVDNDFIQATGTLLDSDFKAPVSYINPVFAASLDRVNFVQMDQSDSMQFSSIQDSSGSARINVTDATPFKRLDLCRIEECNVPEYNGDWLITTVSSNFIVIDRPFSTTATGSVSLIKHSYTNTEDVHIFIAVTYDDDNVSRFSNNESYQLVENTYSNISYAFFNLLNTGNAINDDYGQSLAFGVVRNQLSYQRTMLEKYWPNVDNILNDPLKLICSAIFPKPTFLSITPLRPVRIKTAETDGLYYHNSMTGYRNSYQPCEIELIKLP